jgi:hypothetical protein
MQDFSPQARLAHAIKFCGSCRFTVKELAVGGIQCNTRSLCFTHRLRLYLCAQVLFGLILQKRDRVTTIHVRQRNSRSFP